MHLLVQGSRISDDLRDIASNIPDVCQCTWYVSVQANGLVRLASWQEIIETS